MAIARKSFLNAAVAPVVLVAFLGAAANANAGGLEAGKCYSADVVKTVLTQEAQKPVIIGNRMSPEVKNQNANFFFVNSKGYGYNIEGDKPYGQAPSEMCVRSSFRDARFNSPNNQDIPSWGKFVKPNGNGIDVAKAYKNGGRLVLAAQSYTVKSNGTEVPGKYIMVITAPLDKPSHYAAAWAVDYNGSAEGHFDMTGTQFTQYMNEYLAHPPMASASHSAPALLAVK